MFNVRNFPLRWNKESFLYIILLGMVLFTSSYKLTMEYGLIFSFTSIFLFLILRLYGLPHAVLTAVLAFFVIPHHFSNIAFHLLLLTEIIFVGCFFYKGRKAKMFFVDALFWLTIGLIALYLINHPFVKGQALYFQIGKNIINGFLNVLLADMLLAYVPFYKLFKNNRVNKNSVSIHQFLFHVTLISIIIPFFLSVMINVWSTERYVKKEIMQQAEKNMNLIVEEISFLNKNGNKEISLQNEKLLNQLNVLVRSYQSSEYDIIITDYANLVYASSSERILAHTVYNWRKNHSVHQINNDFYEVLPNDNEDYPIGKWNKGNYLFTEKLEPLPLKLVIQYPISQFQNKIYTIFLDQLKFSLIFALCIAILVHIVSNLFMKNVKQLTTATTGLPQKLIQFEKIDWPQSYVSEMRLLTENLVKMADKIIELFRESTDMNEKLKKQTEKLTHSEDELHRLAFYDVLTGLPNRLYFQDFVKSLIQRNTSKHIAIIFIDINQFKQINDTLGHVAGDTLLQLVANKLRTLHDDYREVFRLGGDEFVIVQNVNHREEVNHTLEQMAQEFVAPFHVQQQLLYISASIGISMYPEDGNDLDTLVKCADIAMYSSKENGGNAAQFFDKSMKNKFEDSLTIENALRAVIDKGGLELYYQPKFCNEKVTSMEVLIRWQDPKLGNVSPGTFIPIAEDIGLILQIDEWVLINACKQNKAWQDSGLSTVPVSVNISAKHFQQDYLISLIKYALDVSGLAPEYLKLEITESVFIKNLSHVAGMIRQLKELGVHISIDDFGKGYSSLYQLLQLPIDEIKIDRQFIMDIDQNEKKSLLVRSILDIAHGLQLNVVAEGIETVNERDILVQMGCDELQGYLFSKPISSEEMGRFLSRDRVYS
ncbi:putative bifunctional diguanylate cyclase/phosphodiesterase [Heyndrickxia sporothermodurans]|uniref:putative bifunctional diguanylate cyclase/phosphodiesterase n=1 Tax=Heyndrickxia sporothermodurans TaxID=46224 RepID=UPI002E1EC86C|nr:EAL domain-containing protein [Heyndrickxia sporothermodurans]MED3698564.1 EAL domain-containing protein [Heyndrickxia sporothermodurans]